MEMETADLSHSHSHSPKSSGETEAHSSLSRSTTMTTPDQSPGIDDDIWDTSSDHPHQYDTTAGDLDADSAAANHHSIPSDIPSLRRQHMTSGYREGLSVGKASVMQTGFDAGYPFGVAIGMRVGTVLGVIEGLVAATERKASGSAAHAESDRGGVDVDVAFLKQLYARVTAELKIATFMAGLDDEKIAAMGLGQGQDRNSLEAMPMPMPIPGEIENVLQRWERVVLAWFPDAVEG